MKIAIAKASGFTQRWILYCENNNIPYKVVSAYDSDIISRIKDCNIFIWHHTHMSYKDLLFAKQLLFSLQQSGITVFPDFNTGWFFDDKVGQKYLLEAIDAPMVPSYVFFSPTEALEWINHTSYPKVFKLRGGAGSINVKLVKSKQQARKLINKSFKSGFSQYNSLESLRESWRKYLNKKVSVTEVLKRVIRLFRPPLYSIMTKKEKGYVYFQDFIPNNAFDIRVCVIGNRAFAIKRMCRNNDFRASGSGSIIYNKDEIDEKCISIAFDIAKRLKSQCLGIDFVMGQNNCPLIIEMGFGFVPEGYDKCEGYWTDDMEWHQGTHFDFCGWIIADLTNSISVNQRIYHQKLLDR